jgi:hypothetical protein
MPAATANAAIWSAMAHAFDYDLENRLIAVSQGGSTTGSLEE